MTPLGGTSRLELRMHERFVLQELMDWQRLDAVTGMAVFYHECSAGAVGTTSEACQVKDSVMAHNPRTRTYRLHCDTSFVNQSFGGYEGVGDV